MGKSATRVGAFLRVGQRGIREAVVIQLLQFITSNFSEFCWSTHFYAKRWHKKSQVVDSRMGSRMLWSRNKCFGCRLSVLWVTWRAGARRLFLLASLVGRVRVSCWSAFSSGGVFRFELGGEACWMAAKAISRIRSGICCTIRRRPNLRVCQSFRR